MSAAVFCAISFKCTSGCFINLYCYVTLGIIGNELSNFYLFFLHSCDRAS
jgi:hypothetical protein